MLDLSFSFSDKCWLWQSGAATPWHFVTLPQDKSEEIKFFNENMHGGISKKPRGWGAVRVQVTIKADVRKKEKIAVGDNITVKLVIDL
jgi:Domain of unknown function (DUF1905)